VLYTYSVNIVFTSINMHTYVLAKRMLCHRTVMKTLLYIRDMSFDILLAEGQSVLCTVCCDNGWQRVGQKHVGRAIAVAMLKGKGNMNGGREDGTYSFPKPVSLPPTGICNDNSEDHKPTETPFSAGHK